MWTQSHIVISFLLTVSVVSECLSGRHDQSPAKTADNGIKSRITLYDPPLPLVETNDRNCRSTEGENPAGCPDREQTSAARSVYDLRAPLRRATTDVDLDHSKRRGISRSGVYPLTALCAEGIRFVRREQRLLWRSCGQQASGWMENRYRPLSCSAGGGHRSRSAEKAAEDSLGLVGLRRLLQIEILQ